MKQKQPDSTATKRKYRRKELIDGERGGSSGREDYPGGVIGTQSPSHYFPVHQAADFCFSYSSSAASSVPSE